MKIRVNEHTIYTNKDFKDLKIINSSDNHLKNESDLKLLRQQRLLFKEEIKPDAICFPGDFLDTIDVVNYNKRLMYSILDELESMAKIAPIYYSMSDHDSVTVIYGKHFNGDNSLWIKLLNEIKNINLFMPYQEQLYVLKDGINFLGFSTDANRGNKGDGALESFKDLSQYLKKINLSENDLNILLYHTPEIMFENKVQKNLTELNWEYIDLVLSGHTHAGLLPKILENAFGGCGIVRPVKYLGTPHYAGIHQNKDFAVDVSRGFKKIPGTAPVLLYPLNHLYKKDVNLVRVLSR